MYGINLTVALQSRKEYVKKRTCSKNVDVFIANFELRKKCPYSELIWSSFFPHSDWIRRDLQLWWTIGNSSSIRLFNFVHRVCTRNRYYINLVLFAHLITLIHVMYKCLPIFLFRDSTTHNSTKLDHINLWS